MHLRTLTLRGFKSFASATTLTFEPGITCVVGPNGSGKSNVVDALAWVMGEQGAKSLRGSAMADVIFAGTTTRPPLGRAEVSLTIDNSDGALPIAYSEVTISRTLFRGGGSEYAINGTPCRLLDIQELLSDTGMGRQMHVIVGQGQLDAVLQATPEERRGFIEEAAGVLKHRRRKDKALRKLEAMNANLQRVTDLSTEIRRQLGPLARQADVARRATAIQAEARDARARLLADDLVQAEAALAAERADEAALSARKAQAEARLERLRSRLATAEAEAAGKSGHARAAADTYHELARLKERFAALAQVAGERVRYLGAPTAPRRGEDPDQLQARADAAAGEVARLRSELEAAQARLEAAQAVRATQESAERTAEHELAAVNRGIADRREGLARLTGQVSARRSRLEAAQAELERTRQGHSQAIARAAAAETRYAELERQAVGAEDGELELDTAHESALAAQAAARAALEELTRSERALVSQRGTLTARIEALELSLVRHDAAEALAESLDGTLTEHLRVTPGWEEAVAAFLGPLAEAAVARDLHVASAALERARAEELGALNLVVAAGGAPHPDAPPPDGIWAVEAVSAPKLSGALSSLLADVVLVEDLPAARALVEAHPALMAVTRAGEVLSAARASGGSGAAPSSLALKAAHDAAAAELAQTERELSALRFRLAPARDAVERADQEVADTLAALHESDARIAAVAEQLGQLGTTARQARAEAERATPVLARLEGDIAELDQQLQELAGRLEEASKEPEQAQEDVAAAAAARDAAAQAAAEARRVEMDARLAVRTLEERVGALEGRAASLAAAAAAERQAHQRAAQREAERAAKAQIARAALHDAQLAQQATSRALERAADARQRAEEEREGRDRAIAATRAELEESRGELEQLTDRAHRDELLRAERQMRLDQLAATAVQELGMDPGVLTEEYGPHRPVVNLDADGAPVSRPYVRAEQATRLARAEKDLARLGKVNPLALEEHAALQERHTFLVEQMNDLKKSRADLMQIVRDIDTHVQQVFTTAFADTAREFEGVFARLFPGGEGRLVLTDPDDMLGSGIEIEARPAGKKVRRLTLLSGGERSLTAVALLVAIFKARPSPFYVMDEVEAALDDTNLQRLLEIFRELQEDSQLIVITHQKRTMEIADALYGVSMRGDGVTQVISQRLHERA